MYLAAPISRIFNPRITVTRGQSEIEVDIREEYFHSAGAVHGSVYFKLLDDAAFFAANSLEYDVFLLTASFTTYFIRPISAGTIQSIGCVTAQTKSQFIAESIAYNAEGKEIGRGSGIFVRGKQPLTHALGYEN